MDKPAVDIVAPAIEWNTHKLYIKIGNLHLPECALNASVWFRKAPGISGCLFKRTLIYIKIIILLLNVY